MIQPPVFLYTVKNIKFSFVLAGSAIVKWQLPDKGTFQGHQKPLNLATCQSHPEIISKYGCSGLTRSVAFSALGENFKFKEKICECESLGSEGK